MLETNPLVSQILGNEKTGEQYKWVLCFGNNVIESSVIINKINDIQNYGNKNCDKPEFSSFLLNFPLLLQKLL